MSNVARELVEHTRGRSDLAVCDSSDSHATTIDARGQLGLSIVEESLGKPLWSLTTRAVTRGASVDDYAARAFAQQSLDHRRVKIADARNRMHECSATPKHCGECG